MKIILLDQTSFLSIAQPHSPASTDRKFPMNLEPKKNLA